MLLTESLSVVVSHRNIEKISEINKGVKNGDVVDIHPSVLKSSKSLIKAKCDYCGEIKEVTVYNYYTNVKDIERYSCSKKECKYSKRKEKIEILFNGINPSTEKRRKTNLEKYGVEHCGQLESVINKRKQTNLEKYGFEHAWSNDDVKEKIKKTNLEKYGVECAFNREGSLEKIKKTNREKYGVEFPLQSQDIQKKIQKSIYNNIGSESITQVESFRKTTFKIAKDINYISYDKENKNNRFKCDKGENHYFFINKDNYFSRKRNKIPLCTVCNPIGDSTSIKQGELSDFIKSLTTEEVIDNYRDGIEIDIFIPHLKIGYEFNGLYWHTEKYRDRYYHQDKTKHFSEKGIRIIHIWEDEWDERKEVLKSQIRNTFQQSLRIPARKTEVKKIDNREAIKFLDKNHLQGSYRGLKLSYGLFHNEELVSVMTFDKQEGRKTMKDKDWNLSRFCNKLNTSVTGGASKLLKCFTKENNPQRIISYADADWGVGNLYEKLGFEEVSKSRPDYKYLVNKKREHKSKWRKPKGEIKTEREIMQGLGIERIYDCGKIKYTKWQQQ